MSDQFFTNLLNDLVNTRIKNKELEKENEILIQKNKELTEELTKIKNMVLCYQKDYYKKINNDYINIEESEEESVTEETDEEELTNEVIEVKKEELTTDVKKKELEDDINNDVEKKNRNEYMKEYMRNKRKQQREEVKKIVVNKKEK